MDVNEARDSGPLVDVETRSDEELRALLEELHAEEQEVSCRRRVLHGKIDILRAELVRRLTAQYEELLEQELTTVRSTLELVRMQATTLLDKVDVA